MSRHNINITFENSNEEEDSNLSDSDGEDEVEPRVVETTTKPVRSQNKEVVNRVSKENTISDLNLQLPTRLCTLGSSQSGKSTLIRHMIKEFKSKFNVSSVWWMGSSAHEESWLSPKFRYQAISRTKIDAIRKLMKTNAFKNTHCIIVLDDILTEKFHNNRWWNGFISTCRHDHITLIFGIQHLKSMSPTIRDNVQYYFVCSLNNSTCDALHGLSNTPDKYQFRKQLTAAKLGHPILFCTIPGQKEIQHLTVGRCEPEDMK